MKQTNSWEWKKLGEVAEITMGQSPPSDTYNEKEEGLPFFQGKAEFGARFPEVRKYCSKPVRIAEQNNILMSVRAPVGSLNIADKNCCIGRGLCAIKSSNRLNYLFLYHFLKSIERSISEKGEGSTFTAINRKVIERIEITVPPLSIQQKIVSILERVESLKQKREQANEEANKIIQSIFYEMFGDPIKNEKGWEKRPLKEIANIQRNSVMPDDIKNMKYVGLEHIESTTGNILEVIEVHNGDLKSNKFLFDEDCVLYGKLRPYLNKIALPYFKGICSTDILPIKPIRNKSNRFFIAYLLKNPYYVRRATDQSTGANLPRLSPKQLESFEVYTPPISLQNQFAYIVEKIESIKQKQNQATSEINTLFDALMQKAFKGELVG